MWTENKKEGVKMKLFMLAHRPTNEEYYKLFVGTHLREAFEKEIIKLAHRLEHSKYMVDTDISQSHTSVNIYFKKSDFSKASLKILNHFAHDSIGSMWETTPSHVIVFDLLYASDDTCILYPNSTMILDEDLFESDDGIIISFACESPTQSHEIDKLGYDLSHHIKHETLERINDK